MRRLLSSLLEQMEPFIAPVRTRLLDLFEERVGYVIDNPWADLVVEIDGQI